MDQAVGRSRSFLLAHRTLSLPDTPLATAPSVRLPNHQPSSIILRDDAMLIAVQTKEERIHSLPNG